ncbi:T9SS type A sorting domain-containing protein [Labilibaculum sp.]|uniref:hemoblobin-interacting domain-containing protein n=1 Tax=Labilibaculum sp. TaxID=2060723 RepID=UPI003568A4B5
MKKYLLLGILWGFSFSFLHAQTAPPSIGSPSNVSVDNPFSLEFEDVGTWQDSISEIQFGADIIDPIAYAEDSIVNQIFFYPSQTVYFQNDTTLDLTIISSGYSDAVVAIEIKHGIANKLVIQIQPTAPTSNGAVLETQPVVNLQDQYANLCTGIDTIDLVASESGGTWYLDGDKEINASAGKFIFVDLQARSDAEITTATITFSSSGFVDVVSNAFTIAALKSAPDLLASSTATVDAPFSINFTADSEWQLAIDSIAYGDEILDPAAYDATQSGEIIFDPSLDSNLQISGTATIIVYSRGYENASVSLEIGHGAASSLHILLQPTAPAENGGLLANQPVVSLKDQYDNDCSTENAIVISAAKGDDNNWTLGGSVDHQVVNGSASYSDLTASSSVAITGAFIAFSADGLDTLNSNTFDIPDLNAAPILTAASAASVDADFEITFTDNSEWRDQITKITYGADTLPSESYDTSAEGVITFKPSESVILQVPANDYLYIESTSFLKDSVLQAIGHGAAASIVITEQPQEPENNAGLLQTQPSVKIQDQYLNDCSTNNEQTIIASATGGSWVVEGTTSLMVTNGIVDFTDLTARSTDSVTDATITFSGTGLTSQESEIFTIPAPLLAPSLIASTTATIDSLFEVGFTENSEWRNAIDSIFYGGIILSSDVYDASQSGKLVFDPSQSGELQLVGTSEILVYSRGYENTAVDQEIKHGIPDTIVIETQPTAPLVNGGNLETQPQISVRDQYNNICTSNDSFEIVAAKGDSQDWLLGGTLTQNVTSGELTYTDLNASSESAISGAVLQFSGEGISSANSDSFDIVESTEAPTLTSDSQASVDADFVLTFTSDDDNWLNGITQITYQGDTLPASAYTLSTDTIVFHVSEEVLLQKSGTFDILIFSLGYADAFVEQEVEHGEVSSMEITQQPTAPLTNGDTLAQQPILQFLDQYANVCTSEYDKSISVAKNDSRDWNIAGSTEKSAFDGMVIFTDLSVYSSGPIDGAELLFSSDEIADVVSVSFDIPDAGEAPILTAASNATVDNSFILSYTEDSIWRSRINAITVNDSLLVADSYNATQEGELELIPSASKFLQASGTFQIIVQSRGFVNDTVQQEISHGVADSLLFVNQPSAPLDNGELLAQQPELKLSDQYLNDCTTDNTSMVSVQKYDQKAWELGGTLELQSQGGSLFFTDLTASSEIAIDSAYLQFSFSRDTVISNLFTVPVPEIELVAAENVTVDSAFIIQASDNASWRDSISSITYAGETLVDSAYLIEVGSITFYPEKDPILQVARNDYLLVIANGYADASIEQSIEHGLASGMFILNQPIGPEDNGDTLAQQPKLQLIDQYENDCENDNTTQVLTDKYSDGSDGDVVDLWELGGTKSITAIEGVVTYLNLTATSENRVEGARLLFISENLPNVVSDSFDIVIPLAPVITGAENATVDESFYVEFTDNASWRSLISDIRYGIRSLEGNYDISEPGKITFDPSIVSILQQTGVDSMYIYSGNYDTVRFEQAIHHGESKYLSVVKQPSAPVNNGDVLLVQPQLRLEDQYRNDCDTDSETPITVKKGDKGEWTLGGTLTQIPVNGLIQYTDLTATSEFEVEGASLEFEGTGIVPEESKTFTIPEPKENRAGTAKANPELVCYAASSTITLVGFDGNIQWQKHDNSTEAYVDVEGEISEILITDKVVENARYRAMVSKDGYASQYSNSVSVSPVDPPIADFIFEINYNQVDFTNLSTNASSIAWDFGDGVISSEYDPSHSYALDDASGTGYLVVLTASNDACPDSEKSQQILITTGIEDVISETDLLVYPNPSRGQFYVEISNSDQDAILRIFNQAGKLVASRKLQDSFQTNRMSFDLSNLSKGMYLLSIQYSDKILRTKLIIQ